MFTRSFERLKREHPTWDASQIAREMQRRSVEARRRKANRQTELKPNTVTYWWQKD